MNKEAKCHNQKFGHNFPYTGADCLNCGINQYELSRQFRKPKKEKKISSEFHELVENIWKLYGKKKPLLCGQES